MWLLFSEACLQCELCWASPLCPLALRADSWLAHVEAIVPGQPIRSQGSQQAQEPVSSPSSLLWAPPRPNHMATYTRNWVQGIVDTSRKLTILDFAGCDMWISNLTPSTWCVEIYIPSLGTCTPFLCGSFYGHWILLRQYIIITGNNAVTFDMCQFSLLTISGFVILWHLQVGGHYDQLFQMRFSTLTEKKA